MNNNDLTWSEVLSDSDTDREIEIRNREETRIRLECKNKVVCLVNFWRESAKEWRNLAHEFQPGSDDFYGRIIRAEIYQKCSDDLEGKLALIEIQDQVEPQPECRKLIDAPALCNKCHSRYVAPTTGKIINRCHCGGELISENP